MTHCSEEKMVDSAYASAPGFREGVLVIVQKKNIFKLLFVVLVANLREHKIAYYVLSQIIGSDNFVNAFYDIQ